MHILILPSWYPKKENDVRGCFFRDQALALYQHGHKVGVVAPMLRSLRTLADVNYERAVGYENDAGVETYREEFFATVPKIPCVNYFLFKMSARKLVKRYVKENGRPDLIHAHAALLGGAAAAVLAEEFNVPLVLTEHSSGYARQLYSKWQIELAKKAVQRANAVIVVSPALASLLNKEICSCEWKWIPNVVVDRFNAVSHPSTVERPVRFLNLALMTENKGQGDLLQAFTSLALNGVDAELWLAGDGPMRSKLERTAEISGAKEKIRFLGLIEPGKVPDLLSQIDVMVISSHYETFGVVAAEALMAGVPVIATRCGGPECIVEKGDGLLVSPKNPHELQAAMLEILEKLPNYDTAAIADRAKARFSARTIASRLTEEYENVLKSFFS